MRAIAMMAAAVVCGALGACAAPAPAPARAEPPSPAYRGYLLAAGGATSDENKPVYDRFIELATPKGGVPHIVVATASSQDEDAAAKSKVALFQRICPMAKVDVLKRTMETAESVALIDQATAMFFTGGDQKRVTTRYLPDGRSTPESDAMWRLLRRNGVIAGTSAGEAMMSDPMFLTGRSAEALGIASTRTQAGPDDDEQAKGKPVLGPQIGVGMGFVKDIIVDSHFFERNRVGRLVAALEQAGRKIGLGVGENGCVEINLNTGEVVGLSEAEALLVDIRSLSRDGLSRHQVMGKLIHQGTRISLGDLLAAPPVAPARMPAHPKVEQVADKDPAEPKAAAGWRFFRSASRPQNVPVSGTVYELRMDGWSMIGWPARDAWMTFAIMPQAAAMPGAK